MASPGGRTALIVIAVVAAAALVALGWAAIRPGPMAFAGKTVPLDRYGGTPTGVPADFQARDLMAQGQYLTDAADCQACHTAPGGKPFAGGRAFDTPFGTIYSPNITPDAATGI